jgi:hypothetical protein
VRAAPGLAALFVGLQEDRSHAVLDLGPAADASLRVYSRFASRIRFTDLLRDATQPEGFAAALLALPPQPERPYDLVFAWDILDQLFPEQRSRLIERLVEVSAPHARLHVVVAASDRTTIYPSRHSILDLDRVRCDPEAMPRPAQRALLPLEVERLLSPFKVVSAFTLKGGLREYVARKQGD